MKQPLTVNARRANAQSPIELLIDGEIHILTMGHAKNLLLDLLPMVISVGSITSPATAKPNGKRSGGGYRTNSAITILNSHSSANGRATDPQ